MEITLSMKEQEKLSIIIRYADGSITGAEAAKQLGLTVRQVQRKKKAYLAEGMSSIIHKSKNKPSGRGFSDSFKSFILNLYKEEYSGWNFCHFGDALEDDHDIYVSDSFLYGLLTSNGIKSPARKKRKAKSHPPRARRENAGELVQVDASKHQWLYGTDEYFYLHGAIDDATGIVTACVLMKQETILGYQLLMVDTIKHYGIPECLYTDYRTVFQSSKANKEMNLEDYIAGKEIKDTRFAAMWNKLGSSIISTTNPRAKGRIERLWRTFQDRLLKELRKRKISSIEEANRYINEIFLPRYNARFASSIDCNKNYFIPVPEDFDYNRKLATWNDRKILNGCYVSVNGKYYVVKQNGKAIYTTSQNKYPIYLYLDGTRHLYHDDKMCDLELVPQKLTKPKVVKIAKPILTPAEISQRNSANAKKNVNSPWRQFNPNYTNRDRAKWDKENLANWIEYRNN